MQAGKHENLLPIDSRILMEMVKHSQNSQSSKFAMSLQYPKKKLKVKLIFCMQINIKISQKFILTLWSSKFPARLILSFLVGMIKHSQVTQSNKFAISLKYLENKLGMEVIFGM